MTRPRYRWRTRLRVMLPWRPPLYRLVPKGRRDCGEHDWYNSDGVVEHCLHCVAERPYDAAHFATSGHTGPEHCLCSTLPSVLPDRNIQGEPIVAAFAGEEVEIGTGVYYPCLDCGQWWRDGFFDDHALRKVEGPGA